MTEAPVATEDSAPQGLPGTWEATYWSPPKGSERAGGIPLAELGDLIKTTLAGKRRREAAVSSMLWWLADLMNYGEWRHGEAFYQLLDEVGYVEESLNNIMRTGASFTRDRRWLPEQVSFWTHSEVRTLRDDVADDLLRRYVRDRGGTGLPAPDGQQEADGTVDELERVEAFDREAPPILTKGDLRAEVKAIREAGSTNDASGAPPPTGTCPLCNHGRLSVTEIEAYHARQQREGY